MREAALELVVLGAGCALPQAGLGPAGYALHGGGLDGITLFDCGPGSVRALGDYGLSLLDVRRVVVSHFHPDHVLDLFALAFARRNPSLDPELVPPIEVVGPVGLRALLDTGGAAGPFGEWTRDPDASLVEVAAGEALQRGRARFTCSSAQHSPGSLSWRLDLASAAGPGVSLTYSGDCGECPALAELARDTDLLLAECAYELEEPPERHVHGAAAGRTAALAGARGLLLSHFYPHVDPERARAAAREAFAGPVALARDGLRVTLEPPR